ncbi:MAG: hypothetical protein FWH07_08565, partial [Oscillospiraceae bacterium]|nr:hypothetical protein [Oscillospiraceae bacterium]
FENRAKSIIENIESCFENSHYDVSLLYRITKPNATFLSSNVYYYHMTGKIGDIMAGAAIKNYSQNLSMIIKCVSQMFTKLNYIIPTVNCPQFATMQIETFDYTIESLSKRTGLSKTSDVRFMLMHSYVSFINMFFELINADKLIELDDCWLFFLAKLYSIRYTEIMDSFDSFDAHITGEEKAVITDLLEFKGFDRKEVLRNFAKKLRDLIHYELLPNFPPIFKSGEYYVDIEQVYLNSVGLQSIYEFKELFYALRFDMKMMQLRFGRLFNLDSRVEDLPLKLARGGKTLVAR